MTVVKEPLLDVSPDYFRQLTLCKKNFADPYLSPYISGGRKLTSEPRKSREWNWDEHVKRSLRYVGVMFIDLYIITDVSFCISSLTFFHSSNYSCFPVCNF